MKENNIKLLLDYIKKLKDAVSRKFKNKVSRRFISIKHKLMITFSVVIIILSLIAFLPIVAFQQPVNKLDSMIQNTIYYNNMIKSLEEIKSTIHIFTRAKSSKATEKYNTQISNLDKNIENIKLNKDSKIPQETLESLIDKVDYFKQSSNLILSGKSKDVDNNRYLSETLIRDIKNMMLLEIEMNQELGTQSKQLITNTSIISLVIIAIISIICLVIAVVISTNISNPLKKISNIADDVAKGDISNNVGEIKTNDELKQLGDSFTMMINNLRQIIANVRNTSERIKLNSSQVVTSTSESAAASEEIAASSYQVTDGATQQYEIVLQINDELRRMHDIIEELSQKIANTSELSNRAMIAVEDGSKCIDNGVGQIKNINTSMYKSVEILNTLSDKSKEISKIVGLINSISEQTNLLALNAAIEAARAGEFGKGFGVVAQEVKKLANQSMQSTSHIKDIVLSIQNITSNLSKSMNEGIGEVKTGIDVIEETSEFFATIGSLNKEVNSYVEDNNKGIKDILNITENIKNSGDNIIKLSKTFKENSQSVAAATQELSATLEENINICNNLDEVSEAQIELVKKFKL